MTEPSYHSVSDMEELRQFCSMGKLELAVVIREFEKLGLSSLRMKVDRKATIPTIGRVVGYQLGEGLQVLLAAFRAGHGYPNEVEGGSSPRRTLSGDEERPTGFF
jgi:hypothetical protein